MRLRATSWRTRPRSPGSAATSHERGPCSRRARAGSPPRETTRASPRCSCGAPTRALAGGDVAAAHAHLDRALELRAGLGETRGRALVLSGLGLVKTITGNYREAERDLAEARTSSGGRATGGASRARSGALRTWPSPATGSTRPKPPCRRRSRRSAKRSDNAGLRARSLRSPRSRCSRETANARPPCSSMRGSGTRAATTRWVSRRPTSGFGALLSSR